MVAVSGSPFSAQLVSCTRRMATTMNASWIAVHVETPLKLSDNQTAQLMANLRLAQELGADMISVYADDTVAGLLQVAHQHNITQIVVGKPGEGLFKKWKKDGSMVDRLIRYSGNIDVYVVRGDLVAESVPKNWQLKMRIQN